LSGEQDQDFFPKTKTATIFFVRQTPRESRPRPWSRELHHWCIWRWDFAKL